jgi:hypothetical protein
LASIPIFHNFLIFFKQYYKIDFLHQIVAPQLSGGWQNNYSNKTRQAGIANQQSIDYLMSMAS